MSIVVHVVIDETYKEGYSYNQNTLPAKHVALGHEVHVVTSAFCVKDGIRCDMQPTEYINDNGVNVHILPLKFKSSLMHIFFCRTMGLKECLYKLNPDIIFVHGVAAVDNKIIFKYKKMHPHVKIFMDSHLDYYNANYHTSIKHRLVQKYVSLRTRKNNELVEKYWGTTPWREEYLREVYKIDPDKIGLLILGADEKYIIGKNRTEISKEVRKKYNIPADTFLIVTGGRLDKRKQQDLLMEAVDHLKNENISLIVFGTPTRDMLEVIKKYENKQNIIMAGWMDVESSYNLLLAADLAFFPGTHSVLWEQSVACGTPSVFKKWVGMSHVKVNNNAILLDKVDIDIIRQTILHVTNKDVYNKMLRDAEEIASSFYLKEIAVKSINSDSI